MREIEQKMDSTLRTVSGEVIAEDIEGYLDSLSGASEGVNPADDGCGFRGGFFGTLGPFAHMARVWENDR